MEGDCHHALEVDYQGWQQSGGTHCSSPVVGRDNNPRAGNNKTMSLAQGRHNSYITAK